MQDAAAPRMAAERLMTSVGHYFDIGDPATDPATGEVTRVELNPHSTKCRVRPASLRDFPAEAGGAELFAANFVVSVPFGQSPPPRVKQGFVIDESPDPALVGVAMQIRDVAYGDSISARRLLCYKVS